MSTHEPTIDEEAYAYDDWMFGDEDADLQEATPVEDWFPERR